MTIKMKTDEGTVVPLYVFLLARLNFEKSREYTRLPEGHLATILPLKR